MPISSCQHPFGTHGIRPLSACQGCTESSTLRDGAGAGHTHSTPSLPPASAENGVSHSPLGFHHSLEAWSPAPDKGPEQAARSKQGLLLQDGAPSNLHHHPMMLAPKITLGRGRWAGQQASVVGAKSHSSQHGWMMKPTLSTKKGPPGCFLIQRGESEELSHLYTGCSLLCQQKSVCFILRRKAPFWI